jgi:protein-L-isoaspartate O-methyltransferase
VAAWVPVEKYLSGQITDLGGTTKANVHLKLDSGRVLTIASSQQLLAEEKQNRLYKPATLRVMAEEHLDTGELRNLVLKSFEDARAVWDEAQFNEMVRRGTAAWKDVPDDWLETLRSGRR